MQVEHLAVEVLQVAQGDLHAVHTLEMLIKPEGHDVTQELTCKMYPVMHVEQVVTVPEQVEQGEVQA